MTPAYNPDDPFNDEERERLQVEALARKFENKYVRSYNSFVRSHTHTLTYSLLLNCAVIVLRVFISTQPTLALLDYPRLLIAATKSNKQVIYVVKINV